MRMYGIYLSKFHHKESLYNNFPECSPFFKGVNWLLVM